jgi:hypothetical protein
VPGLVDADWHYVKFTAIDSMQNRSRREQRNLMLPAPSAKKNPDSQFFCHFSSIVVCPLDAAATLEQNILIGTNPPRTGVSGVKLDARASNQKRHAVLDCGQRWYLEGGIRMKNLRMAIWMTAGALLLAAAAFPQSEKPMGQGRAVVTILPKQHSEMPASISQQDVSIKVNGKPAIVTSWATLRGPDARLELVILIDSSARNSLGSQFGEIEHFVNGLPMRGPLSRT